MNDTIEDSQEKDVVKFRCGDIFKFRESGRIMLVLSSAGYGDVIHYVDVSNNSLERGGISPWMVEILS